MIRQFTQLWVYSAMGNIRHFHFLSVYLKCKKLINIYKGKINKQVIIYNVSFKQMDLYKTCLHRHIRC